MQGRGKPEKRDAHVGAADVDAGRDGQALGKEHGVGRRLELHGEHDEASFEGDLEGAAAHGPQRHDERIGFGDGAVRRVQRHHAEEEGYERQTLHGRDALAQVRAMRRTYVFPREARRRGDRSVVDVR
ncbi:hypothetical protein H257_03036 [Aphanomyces astaci]|uniref:Uncharacterized protein n=1 Tax=Aphanomyces astaci TaxID=112090 RepID=W4GZZ1_APHAT|nr:hypothetical protein H257_03036 [Aphanomyces astaci]ETV85222.1 hypothetical protein H257_03036 [Aphanomyces astaci]|eukprot:XP_009825240.1 hypothetical protein H257_03036 [Aphanomyces astaci]